jgi:hypothetical protein
MFAEMLVEAQGSGNAEEIAKTMTLVEIIYQLKKAEEPVPVAPEAPSEPVLEHKIRDFWSWLTTD